MILCDHAQCPARALREIYFDNGFSLFTCLHHAGMWFAWIKGDERFSLDQKLIVT